MYHSLMKLSSIKKSECKYMKNWLICLLCACCLCLAATGCGRTEAGGAEEGKLTVVTTLFPQYDFARQIGGEYADVSLVLLPGMESHMYDPTPGDMIAISDADIFIYTGGEMEPWAQELADSVDMSRVRVVDASEDVDLMAEDEHEHDHHGEDDGHHHEFDPHIWLDMENAIKMAESIADAFCETDPSHRDYYMENARNYIAQLEELDLELERIVAEGNRRDIVFGGRFAYGYFIHAYDLRYESVYDSCSAETEPSMAQMAAVIDYVQDHGIKYILYEELSTPNVARAIAEATNTELLLFSTCHNVTKDEFEAGITFIDLMRRNAETLRKALE